MYVRIIAKYLAYSSDSNWPAIFNFDFIDLRDLSDKLLVVGNVKSSTHAK
jgi:hypothetical protein